MNTRETADTLCQLFGQLAQPLPDTLRTTLGDAATIIRRQAAKLNRLNLDACNGVRKGTWPNGSTRMGWDEEDQRKADTARATAIERTYAALRSTGLDLTRVHIRFEGEPRGAPIQVYRAGDRDGSGQRLAAFS